MSPQPYCIWSSVVSVNRNRVTTSRKRQHVMFQHDSWIRLTSEQAPESTAVFNWTSSPHLYRLSLILRCRSLYGKAFHSQTYRGYYYKCSASDAKKQICTMEPEHQTTWIRTLKTIGFQFPSLSTCMFSMHLIHHFMGHRKRQGEVEHSFPKEYSSKLGAEQNVFKLKQT